MSEIEPFDKFDDSPVIEPKIESKPKKELKTINAEESGRLIGSTLDEQFRLARCYSLSGLMPKGLNTPEKVFVALQLCHELNLPPMISIGKIAVINGTPSIFGDLPLALVQRSSLLESMNESSEGEGDSMKATCTVKRKNLDPVVRTFSMLDAKKAGLSGSDTYKKYPQRMLQYRARSWALKDSFPDILMGISIAEYDFHSTVVDGQQVGDLEIKSKAEELTERFKNKSAVEDANV